MQNAEAQMPPDRIFIIPGDELREWCEDNQYIEDLAVEYRPASKLSAIGERVEKLEKWIAGLPTIPDHMELAELEEWLQKYDEYVKELIEPRLANVSPLFSEAS